MRKTTMLGSARIVSTALILLILVLGSASGAKAQNLSQVTTSFNDPNGQGTTTYTLFFSLPSTIQVGNTLVVPFKLYVDNLTRLESYLNSYNVTLTLNLGNGKQISDVVGVTGEQAAENLGGLQLHEGQGWGPVNFTLPLTTSNTGLSQAQEVGVNATFNIYSQVYFNQPINNFRFQSSNVMAAYMAIEDGVPAGSQVNYLGISILGIGIILLVLAVAMRGRKSQAVKASKASAGAV